MTRSDAVALAIEAGLDRTIHPQGGKSSAERVIDTLVALGVLVLNVGEPKDVAVLRPPEEYLGFAFHWLEVTDDSGVVRQMPAQWLDGTWNVAGVLVGADKMGIMGRWRYVAPCPSPLELQV